MNDSVSESVSDSVSESVMNSELMTNAEQKIKNDTPVLPVEFYKTLLDSLFDAVYTVDRQAVITYWNDSCARITGYPAAEIIGQPYEGSPLAYGQGAGTDKGDTQWQAPAAQSGIRIVLETGMQGTWKGYARRKNGQRIPIESHVSTIRDEQGRITGAVEVFRDISTRVALEDAHRQVLLMSRKDQLTGLFNRSAVSELLKAEIERARRYGQELAVVMMDIDLFKRINDRYGHDWGDKVLAKMGAILKHNLRKPDVVGRWGGEEFLIVAPGSNAEAGAQLAERLREYIKAVPQDQVPEPITASFGVGQLTGKQEADKLLYVADMALYQAKRAGRDRVEIGSA